MPADKAPSSPQWAAFLESLKEEYPEEFNKKSTTLKEFLKDADQNIAVEEDFLDNPDFTREVHEEEIPDDESK